MLMIVLLMKMRMITLKADLKAKVIGGYDSKKSLRRQNDYNILEALTKVLLFCVPCLCKTLRFLGRFP